MDDVVDNAGMEGTVNESFRSMESLLETWLAGARLGEIAHLIVLAKVELTRRGITLTWSISQTDAPRWRKPP